MKRAFVFGTGLIFENNISYWKQYFDIIGLLDNSKQKQEKIIAGYPVFSPEVLENEEYDVVLIATSRKYVDQIRMQLISQYRVSEEEIYDELAVLKYAQRYNRLRYEGQDKQKEIEIYDCFPFFNELNILQMRLETLNPYVDHFVLCEMRKTHRGKDKELLFQNNKEIFSKYLDKIIYISPEDIPEYQEMEKDNWILENFQRKKLINGLADCKEDDVIMISDVDEIPNPEIVKKIKNYNNNSNCEDLSLLDETAMALEQDLFYYYFNNRNRMKWYGTVVVRYKNLICTQWMRNMRNSLPIIKNGGWHFSYFGDVKTIKLKTESIVDAQQVSMKEILERVSKGMDFYGRLGEKYEFDFIDIHELSFPKIEYWVECFPQFMFHREF